MALIALGHTRCAFCDELLEQGQPLVAASDGPTLAIPGVPMLYDNAMHQACFNRWPLRRVYKRPDLQLPNMLEPDWPPNARWAVIDWSQEHMKAGLPTGSQWIHPATVLVPAPPSADRWSLRCEFDPPANAQDPPSLARVRFVAAKAPAHLLIPGTQLGLFDPGFPEARVYVL